VHEAHMAASPLTRGILGPILDGVWYDELSPAPSVLLDRWDDDRGLELPTGEVQGQQLAGSSMFVTPCRRKRGEPDALDPMAYLDDMDPISSPLASVGYYSTCYAEKLHNHHDDFCGVPRWDACVQCELGWMDATTQRLARIAMLLVRLGVYHGAVALRRPRMVAAELARTTRKRLALAVPSSVLADYIRVAAWVGVSATLVFLPWRNLDLHFIQSTTEGESLSRPRV